MATLTFGSVTVPLREDKHGAIRIRNTRVLLDLVIHEFRNGATPENIVESFDALSLSDVYAVLSYYLQHTKEINAYIGRREQEAQAVRAEIEASQLPRANLRDVLMARASARGKAIAPPDQ